MQYRLRTLLIVLALAPPAGVWFMHRILRTSQAEVTWIGELSLIHGAGQTFEPDAAEGEAP